MRLVLFPGLDGTGELFDSFAASLPESLDPISVAYPSDQLLTYAELTSLARSLLPKDEPFLILGESFSGPVAIRLAAEASENLVGMVLCCTFAKNPQPKLKVFRSLTGFVPIKELPACLSSYFLMGSESNAAQRAAFERALGTVHSDVLRHRLKEVLDVDVSDALAKVRVPSLYLRATKDKLVPEAALRTIQAHLPDLQVASFDAPHFLLQTKPDLAIAAMVEFFNVGADVR